MPQIESPPRSLGFVVAGAGCIKGKRFTLLHAPCASRKLARPCCEYRLQQGNLRYLVAEALCIKEFPSDLLHRPSVSRNFRPPCCGRPLRQGTSCELVADTLRNKEFSNALLGTYSASGNSLPPCCIPLIASSNSYLPCCRQSPQRRIPFHLAAYGICRKARDFSSLVLINRA